MRYEQYYDWSFDPAFFAVLLQKDIVQILKEENVEVIDVDGPVPEVDGKVIEVYTRKISWTNFEDNFRQEIRENNIVKCYLFCTFPTTRKNIDGSTEKYVYVRCKFVTKEGKEI